MPKVKVITAKAEKPVAKTATVPATKKAKPKESKIIVAPIAAKAEPIITKKTSKAIKPVIEKQILTATAKPISKKAVAKKPETSIVTFQLKFNTTYGQALFITGNHDVFGNGNIENALPMQYFNNEFWFVKIDVVNIALINEPITYNYVLKSLDGTIQYDCGDDKQINFSTLTSNELLIIDSWNYTGYTENAFYTQAFQNVLLKNNSTETVESLPKQYTHTFQTKTPLLTQGQTLCMVGSGNALGNWNTDKAVVMTRVNNQVYYKAYVDLSKEDFPIAYKYGIYDTTTKQFVSFEEGNNRIVYDAIKPQKQTIVNDAFTNFSQATWRGAGVAIPVFSLKTAKSFGVGEFSDLKALVDWSFSVGLKLIQILPINDTTATHTWQDSYPYAAISAFALNPIYINLYDVANKENAKLLKPLETKRLELNGKNAVDYEAVLTTKIAFLKKIYPLQSKATFEEADFKEYFNNNKHWLVAYAVFCYLRDEYKTANYNEWPAYKNYNEKDIAALTDLKSKSYNDIAFNCAISFTQTIAVGNSLCTF
jgi:4-alpha-glucanotransferase